MELRRKFKMVDFEKLSSMSEDKKEDGGINIMDAIKGVTNLIKEAKGLKDAVGDVQQQQPVDITPKKPMVQATKPTPKPAQIEQKPATVTPAKAESSDEQVEGYFDKVLQALDMGAMLYGDVPISEFKGHLQQDKAKIITLIKGLM
jgi:hypothetical protein